MWFQSSFVSQRDIITRNTLLIISRWLIRSNPLVTISKNGLSLFLNYIITSHTLLYSQRSKLFLALFDYEALPAIKDDSVTKACFAFLC
jgi:hypothetical protein